MSPTSSTGRPAGPTASSASGLDPARPAGRDWPAWVALAVVLTVGIVVRAVVVFKGDWPIGINGGYYPVQVRAILRSGTLALPDFPLLFYVQAMVALILRPFCADPGNAILLATQLTDTVLPCLVALPVLLLARAWVPAQRRGNLPVAVLAAGLVAVLNPLVLRMAGDMQKNAAGLGLALLFVVCADSYLRSHRTGAAVGALLSLGLAGVTHLGVFGLTLLLAVLLGTRLAWDARHRRRLWLAVPILALVAVAVALLIFAAFDSVRIERLTSYLTSPGRFLRQGPGAGPGAPGPGMPGPPLAMLLRPEVIPGLALGFLGLWMCLLLVDTDRVQRHTVAACSLAALALACPWLSQDMGTRLALMAVLPGLVGIVFALVHWPRLWSAWVAGGMLVALTLAGTARTLRHSPPGTLRPETVAELRLIAAEIKEPARALIVARHGLEWWAAWFTNAHIANNLTAALSGWERYEQVYALSEVQPQGPGMMPPGMGPQRPGLGRQGPAPGGLPGDPGRRGPAAGNGMPFGPGMMGPGPDPRERDAGPQDPLGPGPRPGQLGPGNGRPGFRPGPGPRPQDDRLDNERPPWAETRDSGPAAARPRPGAPEPWRNGPNGPPPAGVATGPGAAARAGTQDTEPVYTGKELRLERFRVKPAPLPARPGL